MFRGFVDLSKSFGRISLSVLKYQIVTKLIFGAIIIPIFALLTQYLIASRGMDAISNNVMLQFLLTPQGITFIFSSMIMVLIGMIIEIYGFIVISARGLFDRGESSYIELLKYNIRKSRNIFKPYGLILIVYLMVLVPLTGTGITLSFLSGIRIPNFITSVINTTPVYLVIYILAISIMLVLSVKWIFTFHFMVIGDYDIKNSMKYSSELIGNNFKNFLKEFIGKTFGVTMFVVIVALVWFSIIHNLINAINFEYSAFRIFIVFVLIAQSMAINIIAILAIPFEVHLLTILFYEFVGKDEKFKDIGNLYPEMPEKMRASLIDRILRRKKTVIAITTGFILFLAIPAGLFFDTVFRANKEIQIVAHRGGGVLAPENTLKGIEEAVKRSVNWTEIDIQRTKDGKYVLNHDSNFKRLSGDNRASYEMNYDEIKNLKVGDQPIATIEEVFDYAYGKIGIFLELKGETADEKMVDDVVKMIKERHIEDQVVLLSLDYKLINYIEENYRDVKTGFLYFMAFGDVSKLKGDYLIMEEDAATDANIERAHGVGKKVIVWTVNTEESIKKYLDTDVDGIITDEVDMLIEAIEKDSRETDREYIKDMFWTSSEYLQKQ